MKRIIKFLLMAVVIVSAVSCTSLKKMIGAQEVAKYNDIRATFVTTQGEINFYLYPEAAPVTVANFINLAQRGYYDNTKIHRAVENFVVQGGDPTETGTGGPGYFIPDEIVNWLDFFQQGMLAMASAGPGTAGSQFFMTLYPAEWLNGQYTIFGEYISDADFEKIRKMEVGDVVKEIRFSGDIDLILSLNKGQVDQWNAILDKEYPNLKQYPVKDISQYGDAVLQYREELENIYTRNNADQGEEKEYFIPRMIRATEKRLKGMRAEEAETSIFD